MAVYKVSDLYNRIQELILKKYKYVDILSLPLMANILNLSILKLLKRLI